MATLKECGVFGDYTVVRLLGKGGMGEVWLLRSSAGVEVAAKILDPEAAADHEARRRFLREAELAHGVKHPNLVETYDVGEDPDTGLCYILMEYVPGGSLADRLDAGRLPVKEALSIVYQIASVLELAREKGIVHRDIKPANIMFGADGKAKLADLGIARAAAGPHVTTVTRTGMMIGTPAYMAPEQMLDAHGVDTRADIYSLGIVLYEMLAGQRPRPDDTVVQLMAKAVAGEPIPDVRKKRPEVARSVAELVSVMCAMRADERLSTPREVMSAISQIAYGREVALRAETPADTARSRKRSWARWADIGGTSLAVIVLSAGVWWMSDTGGRPSVAPPGEPAAGQDACATNAPARDAVDAPGVPERSPAAATPSEPVLAEATPSEPVLAEATPSEPVLAEAMPPEPVPAVAMSPEPAPAERTPPKPVPAPATLRPSFATVPTAGAARPKVPDRFDWDGAFDDTVAESEALEAELRKSGRETTPEMEEKSAALRAVRDELRAAAEQVVEAGSAWRAEEAVQKLERQLAQFLRLRTSATGRCRLKPWEAQVEVVEVAESKVRLLSWLLDGKAGDRPAHVRLDAAVKAAKRDLKLQTEKLDRLMGLAGNGM